MVLCQRKLTFETNKYALREETQNLSVKTGKKSLRYMYIQALETSFLSLCWQTSAANKKIDLQGP
jgi:hypothetical protein